MGLPLIGLGVVLVLLALGLGFTIFGEILGVLGVGCFMAGIITIIWDRVRPSS